MKSVNAALGIAGAVMLAGWAVAAGAEDNKDFSDGIFDLKEDAIASYDSLGDKDTNINFTVVEALSMARKNRDIDGDGQADDDDLTNFFDGTDEYNENSIVVEAGSRVDKVINVIIQK